MKMRWRFCCLVGLIILTSCNQQAEKVEEVPPLYTAIELANKGQMLSEEGKLKAALSNYNKIIVKFEKSTDEDLQEEVAKAFYNKALTLLALQKKELALNTYSQLVARFGNNSSTIVQEQVAKSLLDKAAIYNESKQYAIEASTYDDLINRYAKSTAANVLNHVSLAYNNKGFGLLLQAKQQWVNENERINLLNQALALFELAIQTPTASENKAYPLGNTAYSKWLLSKPDEAKAPLREAFSLGGETLYKGELEDTKQFTVAIDAGFVELIEHTWAEVKPKPAPTLKAAGQHKTKI